MNCAKCKWWGTEIPAGTCSHRPCENPKLHGDAPDHASVDDGYGRIETGPKFGCIHFEDFGKKKKPGPPTNYISRAEELPVGKTV